MERSRAPERGYTLIEMLVVLFIIAVLAGGAIWMTRRSDRRVTAVRGVLDEIEACLISAQHKTALTNTTVTIITNGTWQGTGANSLLLDPRPFDITDTTTNVYTRRRVGTTAELFRSRFTNQDWAHNMAGIDTDGGLTTTALAGRTALSSVSPCDVDPLNSALLSTNRLFNGGQNRVDINGITKRFTTGFHVVVTGINSVGALPNGPVGVLVVPANSAVIYKFYLGEGETTWRRL